MLSSLTFQSCVCTGLGQPAFKTSIQIQQAVKTVGERRRAQQPLRRSRRGRTVLTHAVWAACISCEHAECHLDSSSFWLFSREEN
ncbi:hypothetical protein SRHO_G00254470 [Serrasalmus rhombeus]